MGSRIHSRIADPITGRGSSALRPGPTARAQWGFCTFSIDANGVSACQMAFIGMSGTAEGSLDSVERPAVSRSVLPRAAGPT